MKILFGTKWNRKSQRADIFTLKQRVTMRILQIITTELKTKESIFASLLQVITMLFGRTLEVTKNLGYSEVSIFEVTKSGGGDDILIGNNANNALFGNDGDDHLTGQGGDDDLSGGQGNDELLGGTGNDLLIAGEGDDYLSVSTEINKMYGGVGKDTFVLAQGSEQSTIHDFSGIDDQIKLGDGGEGISIMNNLNGNTSIYQNGDLLRIVNEKSTNALEVGGNYIIGVVNYM